MSHKHPESLSSSPSSDNDTSNNRKRTPTSSSLSSNPSISSTRKKKNDPQLNNAKRPPRISPASSSSSLISSLTNHNASSGAYKQYLTLLRDILGELVALNDQRRHSEEEENPTHQQASVSEFPQDFYRILRRFVRVLNHILQAVDFSENQQGFFEEILMDALAAGDEEQSSSTTSRASSKYQTDLRDLILFSSTGLVQLIFFEEFLMYEKSPTLQQYLNHSIREALQRGSLVANLDVSTDKNALQTWNLLFRCLSTQQEQLHQDDSTDQLTQIELTIQDFLERPQEIIQSLMDAQDLTFYENHVTLLSYLRNMHQELASWSQDDEEQDQTSTSSVRHSNLRKDPTKSRHLLHAPSPNSPKRQSVAVTMSRNQIRDLASSGVYSAKQQNRDSNSRVAVGGKRASSIASSQQPKYTHRKHPHNMDSVQMSINENAFTAYDPSADEHTFDDDDDTMVEMGIHESMANFPSRLPSRAGLRESKMSPQQKYSGESDDDDDDVQLDESDEEDANVRTRESHKEEATSTDGSDEPILEESDDQESVHSPSSSHNRSSSFGTGRSNNGALQEMRSSSSPLSPQKLHGSSSTPTVTRHHPHRQTPGTGTSQSRISLKKYSPSNYSASSSTNSLGVSTQNSFDRAVRDSVAEFDATQEEISPSHSHHSHDLSEDASAPPELITEQNSYHPENYDDVNHSLDESGNSSIDNSRNTTFSPQSHHSSTGPGTPKNNSETPIKFVSPRARPTTSTLSQKDFWNQETSKKQSQNLDHRRRSYAQFDQLNNEARKALIVPKKKEHLSETDQLKEMKKENHMLRMMLLDQQMKTQRDRQEWDSLLKQEQMKARTETMRHISRQKRPSSVQGPRTTSNIARVDGPSTGEQGNGARPGARRRPSTTPGGSRGAHRATNPPHLSDSTSSHSSHSNKRGPPPSPRVKIAGNRTMIENSIRRACFPGKINEQSKIEALEAIHFHETDRYLISLARENSATCRGVYAVDTSDPEEPVAVRIFGKGPKKFSNKSVKSYFRYNSTKKAFQPQESKTHTLSDLRVDAVLLARRPVRRWSQQK